MDDPESWRWAWLVITGVLVLGEILTPGSFFLLPFAAGAALACVAAFLDAGVGLQWLLFLGGSIAGTFALIPLRRRLDRAEPLDGIGARRLLNQDAVVIRAIGPGPDGVGFVRIGREEWRAESATRVGIPDGTQVRVVEVRGTAVVVSPVRSTAGGSVS